MTRPISEYREALSEIEALGFDEPPTAIKTLSAALDELEQARATAETNAELAAQHARLSVERDTAREHVQVLREALLDMVGTMDVLALMQAGFGRDTTEAWEHGRSALLSTAPTPATEPAEPEGTT